MQKVIAQTQTHLKNINYLTLKSKVKLRSRWNTTHRLMVIHGTPTYQISLIYRKRQKGYDSDTITLKKYQLFDLKVKGQRQNVVMLVHDTPSHDYTPTYQISLTYLKRQKSYGPTVNFLFYLECDPPIFEFYLFNKHLNYSITKNQKILWIRN
jgi:hypothetical protein